MSEIRAFLDSFRSETVSDIRDALSFESGACSVAFRAGRRLVTRRVIMPVAERLALSVRALNAIAFSVRDSEPNFSEFTGSVTDWVLELTGFEPSVFEPDADDIATFGQQPPEQSLGEIRAIVRDPRALEILERSGLGSVGESRPPETDPLRRESAALRWVLGKLIDLSGDDRTDLAFVRSQHVRRALDRAGVSLPEFRAAHQQALDTLLELVEPPYWELDELLTSFDPSSVDHRYTS